MSETIHNLTKSTIYPNPGHYTVGETFEGIYTSTYQTSGCFYTNPIHSRWVKRIELKMIVALILIWFFNRCTPSPPKLAHDNIQNHNLSLHGITNSNGHVIPQIPIKQEPAERDCDGK